MQFADCPAPTAGLLSDGKSVGVGPPLSVRGVTTKASGTYSFTGLAAGTYCVMVNSRQSSVAFPRPGVWSRPSGRSSYYLASYTVYLAPGKSRGSLYFGWDRVGAL